MKIKKNGEVIKLSESDLKKIVKRVLDEELTFNVLFTILLRSDSVNLITSPFFLIFII